MDANDDNRPVTTDRESADTSEDTPTPLQPWLRRFASVVGFASAEVSAEGNRAFS